MDSVKEGSAKVVEVNEAVYAKDFPRLIQRISKQARVLSLDCFDTLLFRKVATPIDAFYTMQHQPAFQTHHLTARLRVIAEEKARKHRFMRDGKKEVALADIYRAHKPELTDTDMAALAEAELATEIDTCYAFPPVVELIRKAHQLGMKIIIVSDTYFDEPQLRRLLQAALPSDVYALLEQIYCSNTYGHSKSAGLFKHVLERTRYSAHQVFHLGDNRIADFVAPQTMGIPAAHFIHFDSKISELARMQHAMHVLLDSAVRQDKPMLQPMRALMASAEIDTSKPESIIGYLSVGPIMYSFAQFIVHETERLAREGKKVKPLFLMRDGYLPSLAVAELLGKDFGKRVRISRFTSIAASFRTVQDIDHYLADTVSTLRFADMGKQLLLPADLAEKIAAKAQAMNNKMQEFIRQIHKPEVIDRIIQASTAFRKRLIKHLQNEADLQAGDTLLFVDLGYTGTSQIRLAPIFQAELNVDIKGCYLLALRTPDWQGTRTGVLDPSWCDDRTLLALVQYIALLEQVCASNDNSVIDYDEHGQPLFSESSLKNAQYSKLDLIQQEVCHFIRDARQFSEKNQYHLSLDMLREIVLAGLGRLLYFPTDIEVQYLQSFEFDVNLGVSDILNLLDHEKGLAGLRRRGLFFMEHNLQSMRTNYPAELRHAGIELVLTLLQQHRTGFAMEFKDLSLRREKMNVIIMHGESSTQITVEAQPTYDGYFALIIPVGAGDYHVGVQFGLHYSWLQFDSAELIATDALFGFRESQHSVDATADIVTDQMLDHGGGLYECQSETGILMYAAPQAKKGKHHVLRIVFRPIIYRQRQPKERSS